MKDDILVRIRGRIHDAPMETEHLLDEAADLIEAQRKALKAAADMLDAVSNYMPAV